MLHKMALPAFAWALLFSTDSFAGNFVDKVDRFTGTRSVLWTSIPDEKNTFSMSSRAFIMKGQSAPDSYFLSLDTWSTKWQYLKCNHTAWLVDGEPAPWIETEYESQMVDSATLETFSFRLTKPQAERLSGANTVEYKVCNNEGAVSRADLEGLRKVVTATK